MPIDCANSGLLKFCVSMGLYNEQAPAQASALHCFTLHVCFVFVIGKMFTYRAQKLEITYYVRMEHSPLLAMLGLVELSGDTCTKEITLYSKLSLVLRQISFAQKKMCNPARSLIGLSGRSHTTCFVQVYCVQFFDLILVIIWISLRSYKDLLF